MLDMVIHGPKAQCMQLSSPLAGYLDATARAFMETSSGVLGCRNRRALCYANFNARKNVMAIPHNAFKSEGEGEMECVCGEICDLFMLQ